MRSKWVPIRALATAAIAVGLLSASEQASSQIAGDFPQAKGSSARTGANGAPSTNGSGDTVLRWFLGASTKTIVADNYTGYTLATDGVINATSGTWTDPASTAYEAASPYTFIPSGSSTVFFPDYRYARCEPAGSDSSDPTSGVASADLRYFEWRFHPSLASGVATQMYGVSAWVPQGATYISNGTATPTRVFPQRYFYYEIRMRSSGGTDSVLYRDVVDTYALGYGWGPIGTGGTVGQRIVSYDGTSDIVVRLYNVMPRNSSGTLTMTAPGVQGSGETLSAYEHRWAETYLTYADAIRLEPLTTQYSAGPVVTTFTKADSTTTRRVVTARNDVVPSISDGKLSTSLQYAISSYQYNGATAPTSYNQITKFWEYKPASTVGSSVTVDNLAATVTGTAFVSSTASGRYLGSDYYAGDLRTGSATSYVSYQPSLKDGEYAIYAYISGDQGTVTFGQHVVYQIMQGTTPTEVEVDQSTSGTTSQAGWVRIGTTTYTNSVASPLTVRVTNKTTDAGDASKFAYADAIAFVSPGSNAVTSTPAQVTARITKSDGTVADTTVVIVADENGVIHCLDAEGNTDGTTTEYWSYPSTKDTNDSSWVDPNIREGIDGTYVPTRSASQQETTAIMPTGFSTSSPLVERINGEDYLFIASKNGRVYCIEMKGRGDYNKNQTTGAAEILPGSTKRVWTYPPDPNDNSKTGVTTSTLGAFTGAVTYGLSNSKPTIFVPAPQGRIYALSATPTSSTSRTTSVRWTYPALTSPTVGSIVSTPVYDYGRIYFGTLKGDDNLGHFYALDADSGAIVWPTTTTTASTNAFSDFRASAVTAHGSLIGETDDYVYALNDNGYLYAFKADDGSILWSTNERQMVSTSTLGLTYVTTTLRGSTTLVPIVTVSTTNGSVLGFLAKKSQTTDPTVSDGTRYVFSRTSKSGATLTPPAFADGWMYFGDANGGFYALAASSADGTEVDPTWTDLPVTGTYGNEDPVNQRYSKTQFRLIKPDTYRALLGLTTSSYDYSTATAATSLDPRDPHLTNHQTTVFDWGETVYMLIYNFPYPTGTGVTPPTFNINMTVDGQTTRAIAANAVVFPTKATGNPPTLYGGTASDTNPLLNGFAIAQFTVQSAGQSTLPPGPGRFDVTMNGITNQTSNAIGAIDLPSGLGANFYIANPIAIEMANSDGSISTNSTYTIGNTISPSDPENQVNGSPDIDGQTAKKSRLAASTGVVTHGQRGNSYFYVADRSQMSLLRPGQSGIDNLRVTIGDVTWQGGSGARLKAFDTTLYPDFEDEPSGFPNISKDYPDISRDRVSVTKGINGSTENPLGFPTSLLPPLFPDTLSSGDPDPSTRVLQPTIFNIGVDVPRFQPPNSLAQAGSSARTDSTGTNYPAQGYWSRVSVFVDSVQNGVLDSTTAKEAFRTFNLYTSVAPDERLTVVTPTVDLGSLAAGTGYSPLWPSAGGPYDPWGGAWASNYKTFKVRNEGNVNLFDVRLATTQNVLNGGGSYTPFGFYSSTSDPLAWLDSSLDLCSNLNAPFAPVNPNYTSSDPAATKTAVIVPKPRPEDRAGVDVSVNPVRRSNPNLGVSSTRADGQPNALLDPAAYVPGDPKLAVSVPIGFPVGSYTQSLAVVENYDLGTGLFDSNDPAWSLYPSGAAAATIPGITANFVVRETRITSNPTTGTAPLLEDFQPTTAQTTNQDQLFGYSNLLPTAMRDSFGALFVAWTSNRPAFAPTTQIPSSPSTNDVWRIYLAGVGNGTNFGSTSYSTSAGQTPLRDLNQFVPDSTNGKWLHSVGPTAGFPDISGSGSQTLFGTDVVSGTESFGSPAFPVTGIVNPYLASNNTSRFMPQTYLAFVGDAQTNNATGRGSVSKVFVATVQPSRNGLAAIGSPMVVPGDPSTKKGKPSVVVTADSSGNASGATVFYGATGNGETGLYFSQYLTSSGKFGPETPLNLGTGFEYASEPSAVGRAYIGANTAYYGNRVIDLSFTGKLRNRANSEVFLGRLLLDNTGAIASGDPLAYLPPVTGETLTTLSGSTYGARGVAWNREYPIQLVQVVGGVATSLLLNGYDTSGVYNPSATNPDTKVFDRQSGMIVYSTRLGGQVYIDPNLGTVRFTTGKIAANATLLLSYQPKFLRVSSAVSSGTAVSTPSLMYDQRYISDTSYWATSSGTAIATNAPITNDRYVLTFGGKSKSGSAARPYITSLRYGVKLPAVVATDGSSKIVGISVVGVGHTIGSYQVDPTKPAVYFTANDEDAVVTVTYTVQNQSGTFTQTYTGTVSLITETAPYFLPIEQAKNETGLYSFIDPFTYEAPAYRRPPLMWMFWSSTRGGQPDVFFETIAPRWTPQAVK